MNAAARRTSRSPKQVPALPVSTRTAPEPRAPVRRARKAATNLSLRVELVQRAKALGLNLSDVVESALERAIRDAEQARWLAENEEAIKQYNAFVEEHGYFGEEFREF
jgi:antitoxin CcdA